MGKPGRKPTPTEIKKAMGNPGKRPLNYEEPDAPDGAPVMPEFLSHEARQEWNRIVPILDEMNILKTSDLALLASYCQEYGNYVIAQNMIFETGGSVIETVSHSGSIIMKKNPWLTASNEAYDRMNKAGARLGLSPSDRTGVRVSPKSPKGNENESDSKKELDDILSGKIVKLKQG